LTSIESFGDRLGPLLLQFSARRPEDNDVGFKALLAMLPEGVRFAVDLNHETWRVPEVEAAVIAAGGTLCLSHRDGPPPQVLPDGPIGYARLRAERYDDNEREALLELLRREGKERDIYIFAKHEAAPPDDPHVGAGLARWLTEELG
jgi:uncharacterized protein YecE (DUF72 family)